MINSKWDLRFLEMARFLSSWSLDPSSKIGAVAVSPTRQILSVGYNGFPRGISDTEERLTKRELKYEYVVHAEKNLVYNACHNGISLNGSTVYVYGLPICSECAKAIIQVGSRRVICAVDHDEPMNQKWADSWIKSKELFAEVGIDYSLITTRNTDGHQS